MTEFGVISHGTFEQRGGVYCKMATSEVFICKHTKS